MPEALGLAHTPMAIHEAAAIPTQPSELPPGGPFGHQADKNRMFDEDYAEGEEEGEAGEGRDGEEKKDR